MGTLKAAIFFATLAMAVLQTHSSRQSNDLTTKENFSNDVQTGAQDLRDSAMLTKKAAIDTVAAIFGGNFGVLKDVKVTDDKMAKAVVKVEMVMLKAIRAAGLAFLKTFASRIVSLIDQLPDAALSHFMQLPFFDFIADMLLPLLAKKGTVKSCTKAECIAEYNFAPVSKAGETVDRDLLNKYTPIVYRIRSLPKTAPSPSNRS